MKSDFHFSICFRNFKILRQQRVKLKKFAIIASMLSVLIAGKNNAEEIVTLAISANHNSRMYSAIHDIYNEAFTQMGFKFQSLACAPHECINLYLSGKVVGDSSRHIGYSGLSGHLERIDIDIYTLRTVSVVRKGMKSIQALSDLQEQDYKVGYQKGVEGYKSILENYVNAGNLVETIHWEYGIKQLLKGEIDVYFGAGSVILPEIEEQVHELLLVNAIEEADTKLYPYLAKSFSKNFDLMHETLLNMKETGRTKTIFENHGIPTGKIVL